MKNNIEKSPNHVNILGINVLSTTTSQVLMSVREKLSHSSKLGTRSSKFSIMTPNPELVLASTKNTELKTALNSATFSISDAIGLSQAAKYQALKAPSNMLLRFPVTLFQGLVVGAATFLNRNWLTKELKPIKGRILFEKLIELANKKGWRVFFLGGWEGEAEKAAENLRKNYKSIKIETFTGPNLDVHGEPKSDSDKTLQKEAFSLVNKFSPQLLFVAFGNPKQEIWIYKNLKYLDIGGAMTVGGTFRYVAGISPLPPKWMAKMGLEWVWRLVTEPYRIGRIFNAFPIFPLKVFWSKVVGR